MYSYLLKPSNVPVVTNPSESYFLTYIMTSEETSKSSYKLNRSDALNLKKFLRNLTIKGIGCYEKAEIYGQSFHGRGMEYHVSNDIENDPLPLSKNNVLKNNWENNASIKSWIKFSYYSDIINQEGKFPANINNIYYL